jgi:serine/threonine protein kinase
MFFVFVFVSRLKSEWQKIVLYFFMSTELIFFLISFCVCQQLIRARDFPIPQSILDPNRVTSAASLPQPSHPVLPSGMPPTPVTQQDLESLYLVSDFMDADLHSVITSSQPLGDKYLQYFILQMMRGLAHMVLVFFCYSFFEFIQLHCQHLNVMNGYFLQHACNVLHRDMKPTNLLVKKNCELMICDLGLARVDREISIEDPSVCMTEHVVTRWYRAPEVILSWGRYTKAIDVWSAGCIMAEILGRTPIFPGKNYIHQYVVRFTTLCVFVNIFFNFVVGVCELQARTDH